VTTTAPLSRRPGWEARVGVITVLTVGAALSAVVLFSLSSAKATKTQSTATTIAGTRASSYPAGVVNPREPSGLAPPGPAALKGYARSYVTDFGGTTLPAGWEIFTGVPGGDPGAHFGPRHVVVGHGLLQLNTWRDPAYNFGWVGGGLCQCGLSQTYGAYFVRSRITRAGPNASMLLWPKSNRWPPEIDFNESGPVSTSTSWTVHYGAQDNIVQQTLYLDLTKWHTWGTIWTPTSITFTVDGLTWGAFTLTSAISNVPMTLDLQQRTFCTGKTGCPVQRQSMYVDWIAEYTHKLVTTPPQ